MLAHETIRIKIRGERVVAFLEGMRLPEASLIAPEKLTRYLLAFRKRNDKSRWLAQAGYKCENWQLLEKDLREQILSLPAVPTDNTLYGQMYEIKGNLTGPNGKSLRVCTIWISEIETDETKFITLFPEKGERR